MPEPYLSIVVPAYNEEARIGPTLSSILAFARGFARPVEVLVVDDGSTDRTAAVARDSVAAEVAPAGAPSVDFRLIANEVNRGKGFSIRRGVLEARGDVVLVSDADLSTPIQEATRLLQILERTGRGLVIGSRAVPGARVEVHQSLLREMMGKTFNGIVRLVTGLPFYDTQCGFKLMTRREATPLFEVARIDGFGYDVEILYLATRRGLPVQEVAVTWRNAPGSKVGLLTDPMRMLRDVLRVRRLDRKGLYEPGKRARR